MYLSQKVVMFQAGMIKSCLEIDVGSAKCEVGNVNSNNVIPFPASTLWIQIVIAVKHFTSIYVMLLCFINFALNSQLSLKIFLSEAENLLY